MPTELRLLHCWLTPLPIASTFIILLNNKLTKKLSPWRHPFVVIFITRNITYKMVPFINNRTNKAEWEIQTLNKLHIRISKCRPNTPPSPTMGSNSWTRRCHPQPTTQIPPTLIALCSLPPYGIILLEFHPSGPTWHNSCCPC